MRTVVAVSPARGNGMWALTWNLDQRIADVNVRTGAHALSEVHSRLLFRQPSFAQRRPGCSQSSFYTFNNRSQFNRITHQY